MPPVSPIDPEDFELAELGVRGSDSSPEVNLDLSKNTATRKFRCNWASRYDAAAFFVGYPQLYVDGSGNTQLSRLAPQSLPPDAPDATTPEMFATQVLNIRGFKWSDNDPDNVGVARNVYDYADLTVLYESVPYLVLTDEELEGTSEINRYFELFHGDEIQNSADYITIPAGSMNYIKSDGTNIGAVPFNSGVVQPVVTIRGAWHRLPNELISQDSVLFQRLFTGYNSDGAGNDTDGEPMLAYTGTVNSEPILNFAPGTLLLNSAVPQRLRSPYLFTVLSGELAQLKQF